MSAAGLLPYIFVIHEHQDAPTKLPFFIAFGFPIFRVVGSALCVNAAQFLVQIRILVLLKTRLLFITIDRLAKEANIDLKERINAKLSHTKRKRRKNMWGSDLASEKCIWALEKWLAASQIVSSTKQDNNIAAAVNNIYMSQYKRHLESFHNSIPHSINPILCISLVVGILLTATGYVGCFYLVQNSSANSNGPLLWLILEILLSIIRVVVWTVNPSWDDSKGLVFELQLASHAPLITCNKSESDITIEGVAPVARSKSFLGEIVAYTGPLSPISTLDSVVLYYILTAEGESLPHSITDTLPHRKLYVVMSAFTERTSRVLFKQGDQAAFTICMSTLEPILGSSAINVRVKLDEEGITEPRTQSLTDDASFMDRLSAHYNEIVSQLRNESLNLERKAFFNKTWEMLLPAQRDRHLERDATRGSQHESELTNEDVAYLRQGQVEKRAQEMYSRLEEWTGLYIALYREELLQDVPVDLVFEDNESVSIVQKHEANEVEYLLIMCQVCLERLLMTTASKWNEFVKITHDNMVNAVIQGTFSHAASPKVSEIRKQYGEETRKNKLKSRLAEEHDSFLEREICLRKENKRSRLDAQTDSMAKRIRGRKYDDPTGEYIVKIWRNFAQDFEIQGLGISSQSTTSSDTSLDGSEGYSAPASFAISDVQSLSNAEEGHHLLSPSTSKHFQDGKTTVNKLFHTGDAFRARMQMRFSEAEKDISDCPDEIDRKNEHREFELMKARCHRRIDQLFSRMENQMVEFEELHQEHVLTANSHNLVEYWRTESLQERRRLLDRRQKYVAISDASIRAVGGQKNMTRALMRSQDFLFIDVNESPLFTVDDLAEIVKGLKSVTGVALSLGADVKGETFAAMKSNINSAVAAKHDVCFFQNAIVTDFYRTGHPYLLFRENGRSSCIVFFRTHKKCDHVVILRHCTTMSNAKVDISLNDHPLISTWGQSQKVKFDFHDEKIHLPEAYLLDIDSKQPNILTIMLAEHSEGAYWFSNVFLPVQPILSST